MQVHRTPYLPGGRRKRNAITVVSISLTLLFATGCEVLRGGSAAELIFHSGSIWTADENALWAQAVAIRDGRFTVVGTNAQALRNRGPRTHVVDLQGRFAVPGFNDSHVHFASAAAFLEFNLMTTATQQEFVRRVEDAVNRLPKGEWIVGGYWGAYDAWAPGSAGGAHRKPFTPWMPIVDALTKDHPLFIQKFDGSEFAANTAALIAAGLNPHNPEAEEVEFVSDADGRFIGLMRGNGVRRLFEPHVPKSCSRTRRLQQTRHALREIARAGVTSISDMSDDEQLSIYRELHKAGELTVRVHFRHGLHRWSELAGQGVRVGSGDEWIRLGALKGHIDGIMGTSTARFFEPYEHDPDNRGRWRPLMVDENGEFAEGKFLQYMLDADRAGLQLSVHAIGDQANHVLLNYLEELYRVNGPKDRRFRLVHAQVLAPSDFPRLGQLEVIAEVQPYHLSDDMRWMEERIGRQRCEGAYAFRTIMNNGALLSFGSDWPGTSASYYPINPMRAIHAAVTRRTVTGEPPEGWFPQERLSIEDALRVHTIHNAFASFEEDVKGSIEVGKLADLTVLSQNLFEIDPAQIMATEVLYTVVGGRIAYSQGRR